MFPVRSLRIACAIVGSLVVALGTIIFTVGFLQCRPFTYIWDKTIPGGKCLPIHPVFYCTAIPTLLLNAVVVCLPLPVLYGLQMKRAHKIGLIAIFSLGSL